MFEQFIAEQRAIFSLLSETPEWSGATWDTSGWLNTRMSGKSQLLPFTKLNTKEALPSPYIDFAKAIIVAIFQAKRPSHSAIVAYSIALRRLFCQLVDQGLFHPEELRGEHFYGVIQELKNREYKNLYDASNVMAVIANLVDKYKLAGVPIDFVNPIKAPSPRLRHDPKKEREELSTKLPSKEAMEAFAYCTNNPINDREEILLRTIDLHIAIGSRINETLVIPLDCWVSQPLLGADGQVVTDETSGKAIYQFGIRYFPEKGFEYHTHWLADTDVPLAKRAIDRLKVLTKRARDVAQWQHDNPGRLWNVESLKYVSRSFINRFVDTSESYHLDGMMRRFGIKAKANTRGNPEYLAGEVEAQFYERRPDPVVLRSKNGVPILRMHETLSIGFSGYFRFKERTNSVNYLLPAAVAYADISAALGNTVVQSIFERSNLTEADGSRIALRTHQSRHWRNTLYKLGGMTEIQQALAMGRKDVTQNAFYQHVALSTELASHRSFVEFTSYQEKVNYLRSGIEDGKIQGALTDTYKSLKQNDPVTAQEFLETHAGGVHVTLWGICTNDFSREPCQKHIQCFDNCGHLHRTDDSREQVNLKNLLKLNVEILNKMIQECDGDAGSDKWIDEQRRKIAGIEKALAIGITPTEKKIKVFPKSPGCTQSKIMMRTSSV
ncbi:MULTISPECIES: hypothetical protein [unclassified Undibacterium]|uniref:hypothetical protein n=1 Tax=unclassified Undibacterium TaxID=2630295 RepID=UPI002AC8ECB6|nr:MULTISPECIES: hypothetical protein [unclassified Undibacterium]MEB0141203.1 hypothetical protein [Undibacterium sp. CCC2.1]MEB0174263.1 hypothetical protein [Undibacterium sp. CCC1.1]MEB0178199.1 hypothetical protein [Undibacterium sp. CCC3.4]MEB0217407.1 hypothetical protein [Undibacterium sp. 5I2]WPX42921.1 hypothetical protein RHM61_16270 [Undibacterium sp. CCC3.4]